MKRIAHLDFETRSRADLKAVGAHRYACDPTTEVLMAAVSAGGEGSPVYLWVNPKFEAAGVASEPEALRILGEAEEVWAHNAPFEQAICWGTNFSPQPALDQWRCTQAMARIAGLPESLEKCGAMLNLSSQKDARGKALIRFFSMPTADGVFNDPIAYPDKWRQFCDYCRQDNRTEREIYERLRSGFPLAGSNLDTFLFTLRMNDVGIPVNVPALQNAKRMVDEATAVASKRFRKLTGVNITQRAKVLDWLQFHGVKVENMQADTLQDVDQSALEPDIREALGLYCQLSYAATKKIDTMLDWVCPDGRLHGVMKFYGAGTGRWAAGGPQIQNAKKATPEMRPLTHAAYDYVCRGGTAEGITSVYGDVIEVLASCIRHFVHLPGSEMLDADYNAIEARVACWLAGETGAIREYRDGVDRYRRMAAQIYDIPEAQVTPDQRGLGKIAVLGLIYGMGAEKFRTSCADKYGVVISEEIAEKAKRAFRLAHARIAQSWWDLDTILRSAIESPRIPYSVCGGRIQVVTEWQAGMKYLFIGLPSGRRLAYPLPLIEDSGVTYYGQIPMSTQWGRIGLYGSKGFENCLGEGTEVLTDHGWKPIEAVLKSDRVWDGDGWVGHDGVVCRGDQPTMVFNGVNITPDHRVFEEIESISADKACPVSAAKRGCTAWQNHVSAS